MRVANHGVRRAAVTAVFLAAVVLLVTSCSEDGGTPVADAGPDQRVHWRAPVQLDGRGSVDLDGDPLVYTWTLVARPDGSTAVLVDPTSATPTFAPDVAGPYEARLQVGDRHGHSSDTVTIQVDDGAPVARAGRDRLARDGEVIVLDGSASSDPDADPLTYAWSIDAAPAGNAAELSTPTQASSSFTPSVRGTYVLTLTVSDGSQRNEDRVEVTVHGGSAVVTFSLPIIDAEYSPALDRLVAVSSNPPVLLVLDPVTGAERSLTFELRPRAVAVSPSGTEAVVGHDGQLSVIDLTTVTRTAYHPIACDVFDLVHGGNGWAYVAPDGFAARDLRSVRLDTGADVASNHTLTSSTLRQHPTRPVLYAAPTTTAPDDLEVHDLAAGAARYLRRGEFSSGRQCGNLWFTDDGDRLITACGSVFRSSADPAADLRYLGTIPSQDGRRILGAADHCATAGLVAALGRNTGNEQDYDREIRFLDDDTFAHAGTVPLPPVIIDGQAAASHGRFVFWRADGSSLLVVMRAALVPGGAPRDAVWSVPPP